MDKVIFIDKEFPNQPQEEEYGNKEYKWKIVPNDNKNMDYKCNKLASQMMYRLYEGDGKAIYIIGILDNGIPIGLNQDEVYNTISMFNNIVDIINCDINNIRMYNKNDNYILTFRVSKDIF
jgi:GTPase